MLKNTALNIAPSLMKLFNLSIITGCPDDWKIARIVPIPKASDILCLLHPIIYRLISILPIVSKVLERHTSSIIMDEVAPISTNQWGFMPGRSTTSALDLLSITNTCLHVGLR